MGFRQDLEDGVRGGFCALASSADFLFDAAGGAKTAKRFGPALGSDTLTKAVSNAADLFCDQPPVDRPPPSGSQPAPGQCPVNYRLRAFITYTPTYGGGPITELFGAGDNNQYPGPLGDSIPEVSSGRRFSIGFEFSQGRITGPFFAGPTPTYELALERVDGLPDDCGAVPVRPPLTLAQRTTNINVGGDNAVLSVGQLNITGDGNVVAGILVTGDTYEFSGELNLTGGGVTFNIGGKRPGSDCCEDEPDDTPGGEGAIIGANVVATFSTIPSKVTYYPQLGDNPDIYIPSLGHVAFKIVVNEKETWSRDYPIKNKEQFVEWDGALDAFDVAGTPREGVSFSVTAVRRKSPENDM